MTKDGVATAAREAARLSRAARSMQKRPIELAPAPVAIRAKDFNFASLSDAV